MPKATLLIFLIALGGCIIQIVPTRQTEDYVQTNNLDEFVEKVPQVTFLPLDTAEIRNRIQSRSNFHVLMFASWCVHCYVDMGNGTYKALKDSLAPEKIFMVHTNDNTKQWEKFSATFLPDTIYQMNSTFGVTEKDRILALRKMLCPTCEPLFGLPQRHSMNFK